MDDDPVFPDWPAKRDELRRRVAELLPRSDHRGPLRPAEGAVVDPDGMATRLAARGAFLRVAGDVEPRLLIELAAEPLDEFDVAWEACGGPPDAEPGWNHPYQYRTRAVFMTLMWLDPSSPSRRWAERWGIPARIEPPFPPSGDQRAYLRYGATHAWGYSVTTFTLQAWRLFPLWERGVMGLLDSFEFAAETEDADLGLAASFGLPRARWDPQREDRAAATKRILGELSRAVRAELARIEADARRVAVPPPVKRTGLEHLAWLARYHFRGESFSAIADAVCKERQTVMEAVHSAAALVGLPLRESSRPGPRSKRPEPIKLSG